MIENSENHSSTRRGIKNCIVCGEPGVEAIASVPVQRHTTPSRLPRFSTCTSTLGREKKKLV